ncbi:adenylate/guanylate cyclase domain-containing protein [Sphingomonas mesophila]|uniref:adenylate/guanylate cyclase domain-containing protein n=1 Tax=Sphingomonas mesophila TaxID=2303576 RepID=UPI000E57A191|nr:adenylate/guanylate cyclase domain-containing protein [Sphingomonas mesophila]
MDKPKQWGTSAPAATAGLPTLASIRADLARVPMTRRVTTILFIVIAMLIARYSWQTPVTVIDGQGVKSNLTLPFFQDAERGLYDMRAAVATLLNRTVPQDKRVLLVTFTPDTQFNTRERSPLDRTTLARALTSLDAMGARAIGIDILIDQPQPDDQLLVDALNAMQTPTFVGYATVRHNPEDMSHWQQEFLDNFLKRITNSKVRPASLKVSADSDNVARSWPEQPKDLPPFLPIALTGRTSASDYRGSIQFMAPANSEYEVFENLPVDLFTEPAAASFMAPRVKDRIVLVGGDLPDSDQFETPLTRATGQTSAGLKVHAAMMTQALDRRLPSRVGDVGLWALALFVVLAGAFTSMVDVRPMALSALIVGQLLFFGGAPFLFELRGIDTQGMPAFGWLAGWLLAYMATEATVKAMGSDEKKFAQGALGKYLPKDIAALILKDPTRLSLTGERLPIFTMFTDIQGFTALSHTMPPETTASILNAYLDGMSDIVLKHGGTIDKFVGDAVVAFWGAPIARDEDGDRALAAVVDMMNFCAEFGKASPERALLGRTRIGLHHGEAIVGNFGGEGRIQYTALGDAMNCAARLEGANKYLKSTALVSDEARTLIHDQTIFRPMGRITLSGRSTPIVVWEPAPHMAVEVRQQLTQLWRQFETGNMQALHDIEAIAANHDNDVALAAFACRLREAGPGKSFELGEK